MNRLHNNLKKVTPVMLAIFLPYQSATCAECLANSPGNIPNRFQLNTDGTAQDSYTGLTWFRCNLGETWDTETQTCQGFALEQDWKVQLRSIEDHNSQQLISGETSDWRMPNLKELSSIININCTNMAIDTEIFPSLKIVYWSATPYALRTKHQAIYAENDNVTAIAYQDKNQIWTMNMLSGKDDYNAGWDEFTHATLLVRGRSAP